MGGMQDVVGLRITSFAIDIDAVRKLTTSYKPCCGDIMPGITIFSAREFL